MHALKRPPQEEVFADIPDTCLRRAVSAASPSAGDASDGRIADLEDTLRRAVVSNRPLPSYLRHWVLHDLRSGVPIRVISSTYGVSSSWVRSMRRRWLGGGSVEPRPMGGKRFEKLDRDQLRRILVRHPDASITEIRAMLTVPVARSAIWTAMVRMGLRTERARRRRPSSTNAVAGLRPRTSTRS